MSAERVALIPACAECEARWLPTDDERWRAYLGSDTLDEPAEVVVYRPGALSESLAATELALG